MRNAFAVCPRKHIAPDDVPTKSVSINEKPQRCCLGVAKEFFTAIPNRSRAVYSVLATDKNAKK